jgi:hypothetical protein
MAAKHRTSTRYTQDCRCDACKDAHRLRAADCRQRLVTGEADVTPGPVESVVTAEIADSVQALAHPAAEPPGEEPASSTNRSSESMVSMSRLRGA